MVRFGRVGATVALLSALMVLGESAATARDYDCSDFSTQQEAQKVFEAAGPGDPYNLDGDGDGIACESLPSSGGSAGGGEPGAPSGRDIPARVLAAVDGDTLKVLVGYGQEIDVRLIGIDTPETKRPGTPIECGGPQASATMHRLADRRRITLVTDPSQDRFDRYGRLLAYAVRSDGLNLNQAMIRRGWADVYVYNNNPFSQVKTFRRAEQQAKAQGRGVWSLCHGDFHSAS